MKTLLSLPTNVCKEFNHITNLDKNVCFCTSDPKNKRLGSGGGSIWLLEQCFFNEKASNKSFFEWLSLEKRILLHAGGQSRRLPSYASSGKILTPIPTFNKERGQNIGQTLFDLQYPLYKRIMEIAPPSFHTLIASGDVYIHLQENLTSISSDADVICYGLPGTDIEMSHHGVFMMNKEHISTLDFMLQKPSFEEQLKWKQSHNALMDIGIWLLSDKAVKALSLKTKKNNQIGDVKDYTTYDLYSEFGCALGKNPSSPDEHLKDLKVEIITLNHANFYHFGTSPELLSSTIALNHIEKKESTSEDNSSVIIQNSIVQKDFSYKKNIWIENSYIPKTWNLDSNHIITGVPYNNWNITLKSNICIDIIPIHNDKFAVRIYGFTDSFKGNINNPSTSFLGISFQQWIKERNLLIEDFNPNQDIQDAPLFPIAKNTNDIEKLIDFIIDGSGDLNLYKQNPRVSANQLLDQANLIRLTQQRKHFSNNHILDLYKKNEIKKIYHFNLKQIAKNFHQESITPPILEQGDDLIKIQDAMFRSEIYQQKQNFTLSSNYETQAYQLLQQSILKSSKNNKYLPLKNCFDDQMIYGKSSVRIDLAGGWSDTPPFCIMEGGNVLNMAINLNGEQPIQVYIKPKKERIITCQSIDLGQQEIIKTYDDLSSFFHIGSPFSIPKAALTLCGFSPLFCQEKYKSLQQQLEDFGCGIDITLLSTIPAGSGLGTSSILASTVLGTLAKFCQLSWSKEDIAEKTLILEQLITSGGGWQDQYGGILPGIKLLSSPKSFHQKITIKNANTTLFTDPEYSSCHLLYYTGITRVAKNILRDIVRGMFLNDYHIGLLNAMKEHASTTYKSIQLNNFNEFGLNIKRTWEQNKKLDSGTNPPLVEKLCQQINDLCLGYKLPGAGGGGFMYMIAKDSQAALKIKELLTEYPLRPNSRFVDLNLSLKGLTIHTS